VILGEFRECVIGTLIFHPIFPPLKKINNDKYILEDGGRIIAKCEIPVMMIRHNPLQLQIFFNNKQVADVPLLQAEDCLHIEDITDIQLILQTVRKRINRILKTLK